MLKRNCDRIANLILLIAGVTLVAAGFYMQGWEHGHFEASQQGCALACKRTDEIGFVIHGECHCGLPERLIYEGTTPGSEHD